MTLLSAIILLGAIIFVHELGHFLFAKMLGVRVLKFSLGFGPKLIGRKYGDTEYLISSVPLGGYVKMLGETQDEELKEEERAGAYNYQKVWKRFVIVFAGPFFNILFAVVIFFFSFLSGLPVLVPEVGSVMPDMPAQKAGLMKGDRIVGIDGVSINQWDGMTEIIQKSAGKPLNLEVRRDGKVFQVTIIPEREKGKDIFGENMEVGLIGIRPSGVTIIKREGVGDSLTDSVSKTWELSRLTVVSIVKLVERVIPANTIGGPVLIVQMAGQQAEKGLLNFFVFMAVININLGVLNLLPIPILDGGHVLFLGIEAIRRKPLSDKVIAVSQRIGLVIILTLMAFALYNDFIRLITHKQIP
jgi:regulator of sigma E protease